MQKAEGFHGSRRIGTEVYVERIQAIESDAEARIVHDENYGKSGGEVFGGEIALNEGFIVVGGKDCVALGEDAEDIGGEFDVAAAARNGENIVACSCRGFEVTGDDLGVPYHVDTIGLWKI